MFFQRLLKKTELLVLGSFIFTLSFGSISKADYFIYQDGNTGVSMSFPDEWYMVSRKQPDELMRVNAPNKESYVSCVIKYEEDKRFLRYPSRFDSSIQKIAFSKKFWAKYMAKHDNVEYLLIKDEAGFAKGHGSHIIAEYTTGYPEIYEERTSLAFVGYNAGRVLVGECSAPTDQFDKYKKSFYSVLKTVEQPKINHELISGDYQSILGWHDDFYFLDPQDLRTTKY